MNDRELLELAAKAAGIEKDDSPYNGGGSNNDGFNIMGDMVLDWHNNETWNPLTDDGDALWLAVKLTLLTPECMDDWKRCRNKDQHVDVCANYRRAIVRAAAEIGKGMK